MNSIIHLDSDGEEVAALVTEIPHKQHAMFKVILESGYSNIFYTDVETSNWVEEDLGYTELAEKVGDGIFRGMHRTIHVPKMLNWHTSGNNSKSVTFGFFNFMHGNQKMFEIYHANRKFLFTLQQHTEDEWQVLGSDYINVNSIDPIFVEGIIKVLPLYACHS